MMLYPIPPPPGFAFHVVEVMSSPRYHLKREADTVARAESQSLDISPLLWRFPGTLKRSF
jgi:AP-3 complex subunit delta-1